MPTSIEDALSELAKLEKQQAEKEIRAKARFAEEIQKAMSLVRNSFSTFLSSLKPAKPLPLGMVCKVPIPSEPGFFYEIRKTR